MFKINNNSYGILYIFIGIILWFTPTKLLILYSLLLGLILLAITIIVFLFIFNKKTKANISYKKFVPYLLGSLLILLLPILTITFISWIIIFSIILASFYFLYQTIYNKHKNSAIRIFLTITILCFAVFILFNPSTVSSLLLKLISLLFISKGISQLTNIFKINTKENNSNTR